MTTQLSLLDRKWCERQIPTIRQHFAGQEWTADDLHAKLEPALHPNWFGILCAKMRNAGLIEPVGYKPSERKERNGGIVRIWRLK